MGFEVVSLGELLIDMVPLPAPPSALNFAAKPGGAPGNSAVGLARLGRSVAMLSKVGNDAFGRLLTGTIAASGAAIDHISVSQQHLTGMAVVTLDADGDRDFLFYRQDCADANYAPEDVPAAVIADAGILHVNSLVLASPVSAAAQRHALGLARAGGVTISVDPNLRPLLWTSRDEMIAAAREMIAAANILKVGEDELAVITGIADPEAALASLWHPGLRAAAVTAGSRGGTIITPEIRVPFAAMPVKAVDTTGCGDSFMAAFLAGLIEREMDLSAASLAEIGRFAAAAGALTATIPGGMDAMPDRATVEAFLAQAGI